MRFFFASLFVYSSFLTAQTTPQQIDFFERKIRPILVKNCQGCHNPKVQVAHLELTTAAGFLQGGASGPLVDKADPAASRLLKVISYDEKLKMPPTGKLAAEEIAAITEWVKSGAAWPGAEAAASDAPKKSGPRALTDAERNYWAFQPVKAIEPPKVKNELWVRTPVDRFILAKLEEKGIQPAPPAGKATLLRRVTFDLTGLPPTEKEVREFLADASPDAYKKVVDRLLASPRYGERWGRHWLDVARYADSTGNDEDHRYPYAYKYRDYVIQAFNSDMPYDQFVREQLAGDLMPTTDPSGINRQGIIATGFLALGQKAIAQPDKKKMMYDIWDEQVDVVSKSLLGVTMACARCHDHKFDPFFTRDYYSLVNVFANTRAFSDPKAGVSKLLYKPLEPKEIVDVYQAHQKKISANKMAISDVVELERERYSRETGPKLAAYMVAARRVYAGKEPAKEVAAQAGLKEELLNKWVKYLAPDSQPNADLRPHLEEWYKASTPQAVEAAARAYQTRYEKQAADWAQRIAKWRETARKRMEEGNMPPPDRPTFDAGSDHFFNDVYFSRRGPFSISEKDEEKLFSAESRDLLKKLKTYGDELKKASPPEPEMADAVEDETQPVEQKVLIRGDYNSPGEDAPKAFPRVLASYVQPRHTRFTGSGRLQLADWITDRSNPLTARVFTNRVWLWHFGEGIVRTPDNFGRMGERPSHPELLDYLTRQFVDNGWSIKSLHRMILLSNAYQSSSNVSDATFAKDPENRLFSRFPRQRLEVEEVRDAMLAIDGTIDLTVGGTLQKGFGTDGENSADRLSLNPEKLTRRTVYLPLRRANLPSLLNLFDFGDAVTVNGKRMLTNVAPQALFMMNSQFVDDRARTVAQSVLKDASSDAARVEALYLRILNRAPQAAEVDTALTYVSRVKEKLKGEDAAASSWHSLARVLFGSNEFIYLD